MLKQNVNIVAPCIYLKKSWELKPLLYSLALTTALCTPSFANTTTPEINVDYLNELTGSKVTWATATESDSDIVFINGAYYKYTYHKPDDYTETNTRLDNNLDESNTQSVVFKNIAYADITDGGAIYNMQNFDKPINADFIGNYAHSEQYNSHGGAIYNYQGTIGNITGNFIENYAHNEQGYAYGGAIFNYDDASIGDITGDFISNYAYGEQDNSYGGAIYNVFDSTIGDITGDFIGNYAHSEQGEANGGAIDNEDATIGDITGDFIGNYAHGGEEAEGGAISNNGTIGDITGNFIGNYAHSEQGEANGGAIDNEDATIGDITGDFIGNYAYGGQTAAGGAISNNATIGDITGDFIGNYAHGGEEAEGGAIYNERTIGDITGNFIGNYAHSEQDYACGGAIYNDSTIGDITGDFIGNYAYGEQGSAGGGAIYNASGATIGDITGNFIGNYAHSEQIAIGGAIYNSNTSTIGDITGDFIGNYAHGEQLAGGGAIAHESLAPLTLTNSSFYNNYAKGMMAFGGAILIAGETLNITADNGNSIFSGNYVETDIDGDGIFTKKSNAIHSMAGTINLNAVNNGTIRFDDGIILSDGSEMGSPMGTPVTSMSISGDDSSKIFFNAPIEVVSADGSLGSVTQTGANVYFGPDSTIKGYAYNISGGSLNDATVDDTGELHATNSAKINGLLANGGALIDLDAGTILTGDVKFAADATLQGNFDYNKIFNEIVAETGSLTLEGGINAALSQDSLINTAENKSLVLSNGNFEVGSGVQEVSGWKELNVTDNATVKLAGDIALAETQNKMNLLSGSTLDLAGNSPLIATIDGSVNNDGNMTFTHATDGADDVITIKGNYKAYKNAMITIDVDPVAAISDKLIIEGDVEGRTKVVINPSSNDLSTGKALFVEAMNDDLSTGAYFDVYRVIGDAHKWNTLYEDNKWYAATDNIIATSQSGYGTVKDEELVLGGNANAGDANITQPKPQVVSEAIAYMSLPRIGLEQTKDLVRIVSNKVTSSKIMSGRCGMGECNYDGQAVNGAWIDLGHKKSEIDAPVAVEAKINAVDLGFDIQKDLHNRLGIFASYRQGEYELSGDGEDYYAKEGADIDIDSWILGLYHRYDYGRLWTMSSIYGGIQKVDMSTDDGVSSDTDGIQFGGSVEAGLVFEPQKRLTIEPSIRLGYNFIKYDDMSDSYGKTAEFDNVQNIEAEAGVKVEKTWFVGKNNITKLYFKPSVIQNFGKGDVNITSLDTIEGLEDETLIRGEIGGSFNFGNGCSGFGSLGYTYGSDYNATDFNIGINYNW